MALLDAAAGVGAEPRGTHIEESFAHASLTRVAADALYRAMVPCALRAARLSTGTPWKAPSHVRRRESSFSEVLAEASRTKKTPRKARSELFLVDWDKIVPSYLAAQRMAGPKSRGWAQAWIEEQRPQLDFRR